MNPKAVLNAVDAKYQASSSAMPTFLAARGYVAAQYDRETRSMLFTQFVDVPLTSISGRKKPEKKRRILLGGLSSMTYSAPSLSLGEQADIPPAGDTPPMPSCINSGSYTGSCGSCTLSGSELYCSCRSGDGYYTGSRINTADCSCGSIKNKNGILVSGMGIDFNVLI